MKKITLFLFLFCVVGLSFSQDKKTFFHTELDMVIPRNGGVKYSYIRNETTKGGEVKLGERILWGANFSYNYELFRNFSVGAVTGISYLSQPNITSLKLGGVLRYTFIHDFQANTFLQVTGDIPVTSKTGADLGEIRFGFSMPVAKFDEFDLTLSAYVMYQRYNINKPLFLTETPDNLHYRGTGLSLGVRF